MDYKATKLGWTECDLINLCISPWSCKVETSCHAAFTKLFNWKRCKFSTSILLTWWWCITYSPVLVKNSVFPKTPQSTTITSLPLWRMENLEPAVSSNHHMGGHPSSELPRPKAAGSQADYQTSPSRVRWQQGKQQLEAQICESLGPWSSKIVHQLQGFSTSMSVWVQIWGPYNHEWIAHL